MVSRNFFAFSTIHRKSNVKKNLLCTVIFDWKTCGKVFSIVESCGEILLVLDDLF